MIRDYRKCPYYAQTAGSDRAVCGLLAQITGIAEDALLCVTASDCRRCADFPVPSPKALNPSIASLIFGVARIVLYENGVPGLTVDEARALQRLALPHLKRGLSIEATHWLQGRGPCVHLGSPMDDSSGPRFGCHHSAHESTTHEECKLCPDWSDGKTASHPVLSELIPPPPRRAAGPRNWAVGITTTLRSTPTLEHCLDSVIRAGWENPRIFMDGSVPLAERHSHLPVTLREPKVHAWPNYYLSLAELLMRKPQADAYLLVQDDALFYDRDNLRQYLEMAMWPSGHVGAVSLYCSAADTQPQNGWYRMLGTWTWGAMAFVFPRESAKRFVGDPLVLEHRWCQRNDGCANIDTEIGLWSQRTQMAIHFPTPSLVQHIGDASTLWPTATATGSRRADRFVGG